MKKSKANKMSLKKSIVVLKSMVLRNVKNQYRNSVLGVLWTILNPLLNMLVMAFVFSNVFGTANVLMDYPTYLFGGTIIFNFLRMSTTSSLGSIVGNYDLMTKTRIPHIVFPTSHVFSALVNFLFSFAAMLIIMVIRGVAFHWTILLSLFVLIPILMLFCAGIGYFLSAIYVRFRDIQHFYSVFLTLWMYATPIFYAMESLNNETIESIIGYNPMARFVIMFRELTVLGTVPSFRSFLILIGFAVISFIIGFSVFESQRKKFIFYI